MKHFLKGLGISNSTTGYKPVQHEFTFIKLGILLHIHHTFTLLKVILFRISSLSAAPHQQQDKSSEDTVNICKQIQIQDSHVKFKHAQV